MSLTVYNDVPQRSDEWFALRRGIVTASTVGQLITPSTIKPANNDRSRGLIAQLVAERITGWTENTYQSSDMLRGTLDEPVARAVYAEHYAPVEECGFMVREFLGSPAKSAPDYRIGYSPDGLVGDDGLIEIKSRSPKAHLATILADEVPAENVAQIQCGLLVSERLWCDYVSFCGGMPLYVKRVHPDLVWLAAIKAAVESFEAVAAAQIDAYRVAVVGLPMTERIDYETSGIEF